VAMMAIATSSSTIVNPVGRQGRAGDGSNVEPCREPEPQMRREEEAGINEVHPRPRAGPSAELLLLSVGRVRTDNAVGLSKAQPRRPGLIRSGPSCCRQAKRKVGASEGRYECPCRKVRASPGILEVGEVDVGASTVYNDVHSEVIGLSGSDWSKGNVRILSAAASLCERGAGSTDLDWYRTGSAVGNPSVLPDEGATVQRRGRQG
jgi:hypothetical protein